MPQFKKVPPFYIPEDHDATRDNLEAHLVSALRDAIGSIRGRADTERASEGNDGTAEGAQWLCYELAQKLAEGSVVALTDVSDVVETLATLHDVCATSFAGQIITLFDNIYAAHCENIRRANAAVSQFTSHQVLAPATAPCYGDLLAGLDLSDAAPSAPPLHVMPRSTYGDLSAELGLGVGAQGTFTSYGDLAQLAASADPTERHVSGREMLDKITVVEQEVAALVAEGDDSPALLGMLGLCAQLAFKVKGGCPITADLIDAKAKEIDGLRGARSSSANTYIQKLKDACRPAEAAKPAAAASRPASYVAGMSSVSSEQAAKDSLVRDLDVYIAKRSQERDPSGRTKEYLRLGVFGSWNQISQNSYSGEVRAVNAVKEALSGNGSADELRLCLSTLRSGGLADILRPLAKEGALNGLAGKEVKTVSEFVNALADKAQQQQQYTPK